MTVFSVGVASVATLEDTAASGASLAASGTATATATADILKDVPLAAAGAAVAGGTADLSTGAAAFKAAAFYYQLLGDCNV